MDSLSLFTIVDDRYLKYRVQISDEIGKMNVGESWMIGELKNPEYCEFY